MLPIFYGTVQQAPDKYGFTAHTPDPTRYHVQGGATMIPRATQFGASRGFQIRAGVVRLVDVDSDETPGTMVDVEKLDGAAVYNALRNNEGDAHNALLNLGQEQGYKIVYGPFTKVQQVENRVNTEKKGYVVPKADLNGNQYQDDSQFNYSGGSVALPRQVATVQAPPAPGTQPLAFAPPDNPPSAPVANPTPAHIYGQPAYSPPVDPSVMAMQQQMAQLTQLVVGLIQGQNQPQRAPEPVAPPPPPPPPPAPEPEPMAAGGAVKASWAAQQRPAQPEQQPRWSAGQAIDAFTEEVGLPFLTVEPSKPKFQVYFDMGDMGGKMSTWYHDVSVTGRCLTLTYDNRYEAGQHFVPPYLGAQKTLTLTIPKLEKKFTVFSGDFNINLGPLDQCILIVTEEKSLVEE